MPSHQAPALRGRSVAKHTGTQLAAVAPLMRGLSRTLPGLERTRSSTLCPLRHCRLAVANEQGWTHHKTALLTTQGSPKSTLYCPLPVQFTPNPAPCSQLGVRPPPAAHEMGGTAAAGSAAGYSMSQHRHGARWGSPPAARSMRRPHHGAHQGTQLFPQRCPTHQRSQSGPQVSARW